jgi:hypothetical protein
MSVSRSNSQLNCHPSWNQTDQLAKSARKSLTILTCSRTLIILCVTVAGTGSDFERDLFDDRVNIHRESN